MHTRTYTVRSKTEPVTEIFIIYYILTSHESFLIAFGNTVFQYFTLGLSSPLKLGVTDNLL